MSEPVDTLLATRDAATAARREAAEGSATLVFRWAEGRRMVDLDDGALTVGRSSRCDVVLPDPSLSRRHARFSRTPEGLRVEDLDSRNGVEVGGQGVSHALLGAGDVVTLGNVTVSVHVFGGRESSAQTASENGDVSWAGAGMAALHREICKIAPTPLPVLITGETGCGKEVVAREVHRLSDRADAPLLVVNCAAIPATLVESTLFGHVRGAFTGADTTKSGVFEQGRGGTVFLDELGELPLSAQAVLLRVLESGHFTPVGGTREVESDARILAATHRDLSAMVRNGEFRLDLLHRLDTVVLQLPALREQPDALEPLIALFLQRSARKLGKAPRQLSADALALMKAYAFPGNVRELRNVLERAVAIGDTRLIGIDDLPARLRKDTVEAPPPLVSVLDEVAATLRPEGPAPVSARERRAQQEREQLTRALEQTRGSQAEAAVLLGWSLRTLQRRVTQFGLSKPKRKG